MRKPVRMDVIAPMISGLDFGCRGCGLIMGQLGLRAKHREATSSGYPPQWKENLLRLSSWIQELSSLYQHRLVIRLIDAQSPMGLWMQVRYRLHRFPAFVIDGKHTYLGWDSSRLEALLDERIERSA